MKVYKIPPVGFAANTYAVTEDGKNCILVDCAQERVLEECKKLGLIPSVVLLTHGHYDHIGGCGALQKAGAKIACGEEEIPLIFSDANRAVFHGIEIPAFTVDITLKEGKYDFCGLRVKAIRTAGHTRGGMCYIIGDCLFSGDTLFYESIGRSDLPTGDYPALVASVKKLYSLEGDYTVYCGHGQQTSLSHERVFNPFVKVN